MFARVWKSLRPAASPGEARDPAAIKEALRAMLARRDHAGALELLTRLETLEPDDPRWPHKGGDVLRSEGRVHEAAAAYRRAAARYARQGFAARANAMRMLARKLAGQSAPLQPAHPSIAPERNS